MGGWTNPLTSLSSSGQTQAPLSTLLPPSPVPYERTIQPGVSSTSKAQYLADIAGKAGTESIGAGTSLLGKPLDYFQNLLQPPTRQGLLERQGPAVASVVGQYSTGKKAIERLPRGGGTTSLLANLPFQEAGDVTSLIERELQQYQDVLQPQAAQNIAEIGQGLSRMGLEELGLSSQDLFGVAANALAKRAQNMKLLGDLGSAIGGIIGASLIKGAPKIGTQSAAGG